jgi:hypothetical protein
MLALVFSGTKHATAATFAMQRLGALNPVEYNIIDQAAVIRNVTEEELQDLLNGPAPKSQPHRNTFEEWMLSEGTRMEVRNP